MEIWFRRFTRPPLKEKGASAALSGGTSKPQAGGLPPALPEPSARESLCRGRVSALILIHTTLESGGSSYDPQNLVFYYFLLPFQIQFSTSFHNFGFYKFSLPRWTNKNGKQNAWQFGTGTKYREREKEREMLSYIQFYIQFWPAGHEM